MVAQSHAPAASETETACEPRQALVRVRNARKSYGSVTALDGLDLTVGRGELLGLLGPNGAGKTTLMHALSGVLPLDAGEVELVGHGAPRSRATRALIGLAPQQIALYPALSARENLSFFGELHGLSGARLRQRVSECLELADLTARAHDRVGGFSGGMQRRLNLAAAVVGEPALLLLDEPTAGVDPQSRAHLFRSVASFLHAGMTLVYSTHRFDEVEQLCTRVAVLDHGRLKADGEPSALCARLGCDNLDAAFLQLTGKELRD